jgi:hypothetical protein
VGVVSKKSRGTTKDANRRRERHARKMERYLPDVWQIRQRHGGRIGKALGCVRGRDVVFKIGEYEMRSIPASTRWEQP